MLRLQLGIAFLTLAGLVVIPSLAGAQIAPGELQSAAHTATVTGSVTQSDGTPVAGADVHLNGPPSFSTKSDAHGTFSFASVPYGTYRVVVNSALGTTTQAGVSVHGDINVAVQYVQTGGPKEIAHVSTHSAGASINVTPASIASINPSEYAFQGNTTWTTLLNRIPGVTVNGALEGGTQIDDFLVGSPITPQIVSINGALPYETSTTLDGMPLESQTTIGGPGCGFDLSELPLSVFDTADVVRGPGANAPSIVDSIGGSLVLHAPGEVETNAAEFSISNDPWGGIVSNLKIAHRFGRLSVQLTYGVNDSPGAFGNAQVIPTGYAAQPLTINGKAFNGCSAGGPSSCTSNILCPNLPNNLCGQSVQLLFCCTSYSTEWSQHNGSASLSYDVTPKITAQVFYAGTSGAMAGNPWGFYGSDFTPGANYSGALSPGFMDLIGMNPYDDYQSSNLLEEKLTAYIGNGVLRLAAVQNNSWTHDNHLGSSCLPDGEYTVYGVGYYASDPNTPVVFNGTPAALTFTPQPFIVSQNATQNRDLLASYAMQIGQNSHIGLSYTKSSYNTPGYAACEGPYSGGVPFVEFNIQSGNTATLNELRFNVGTDISDKLSVDGSWYFTNATFHIQSPDYVSSAPWLDSTFSYSAPRVGITWRANENVAVRAAAGGGFAIPTLSQLGGESGTLPTCSVNICSEGLANLNLKPEESFGFDIGTDVRLHHDTAFSFDLYRNNLYGQFYTAATLVSTSYTGLFCTTPPCSLYDSQYNNLAQTRYEGINLSVHHDPPVRGIYWQASAGLIRAYIVSLPAGFYNDASCPNTPCTNTYLIPGENFESAAYSRIPTVPYANGSATIGYRWSPRKFIDLAPTYYGNGNAYFEPAFMEFDAHGSYPLGRNVTLFATFRNITNIYGQSFETVVGPPTLAAPTVSPCPPNGLLGIPYGPRAVIVTANFKSL